MADTNNSHWHQLQALNDRQAKIVRSRQSYTRTPEGYQITGYSLYQYTQATVKRPVVAFGEAH